MLARNIKKAIISFLKKRKQNQNNFNQLFELWQKALPLLSERLYTYYSYTYGMRNVKGKPRRSYMTPCAFNNETPEICFRWKDMGDYYKLELRLGTEGKIHQIEYNYNTAFFAMLFYNPRRYALLNSVIDSELLVFSKKAISIIGIEDTIMKVILKILLID